MTARAWLQAAAAVAEVGAGIPLWFGPPIWAGLLLTVVIFSFLALTWEQRDARVLPDGGRDFLLLRFWDVAMLRAGGAPLAEAWRQCFSEQAAQPPP